MVSVKKFYLRGNIIPRVPARACPKIFKFNWIARYHEPGGYFITNISLHEFINNADDFKFNEVYRLEKLSFTLSIVSLFFFEESLIRVRVSDLHYSSQQYLREFQKRKSSKEIKYEIAS